jgi:hypothetical protein
MSQQFKIGDKVLVVIDEGLDTPPRAQGKTGMIIGKIGESEYVVKMPDGLTFNATFYHIIPIPKLVQYTDARHLPNIIRENDPDLHERIRQISDSHYRLRDFSDATTIFALLWLGVQALDDNPRTLEGSGIHEML